MATPNVPGCGMARLTFSILLLLLLLGSFSSLSKAQNGTVNSSAGSGSGEAGTEQSHEGEAEDECRVERERAFDSEVRIASFNFEEVRVLITVTGFIMAVVVAKMGEFKYCCVIIHICV